MKFIPQIFVLLLVIGIVLCTPLPAQLRYFSAQPVAPDTFGLSWKTVAETPGVTFVVSRQTASDDYVEIGKYEYNRTDGVDVVPDSTAKVVRYKITEILNANQKVVRTLEALAVGGVNLVANGDFELAQIDDTQADNIGITAPTPWQATIVAGGLEPGDKCLQLQTPQPENAPRYYVSTNYYRVCPDTTYTFSWHTTETAQGCAGGIGQAYGYTREEKVSLHAKVASLYIYMADRKGPWIEYWGQPWLPPDLRSVYIRLYTKGYYQPEPILIDNIRIADHDIELLSEIDLPAFLEDLRQKAQADEPWLSSQKVQTLTRQILRNQHTLNNPGPMTLDDYFAVRTELCAAIRQLQKDLYLFNIAKLKT